jgi:two-component system response regulator AtoC
LLFGNSSAMRIVRQVVERAALTSVPVLIWGESGVGKETIARQIHRCSPWAGGPFVKVSCPAIPGTLIESELFGYEKGAFTGAWNTKPGQVDQANRGTLFLDEIAEMEASLQAKLLQVLQDGQFSRIGAQQDTQANVRVVCATSRDLEQEVASGRFRQDLYYRINVVQIHVPPLRQRSEDIPALVEFFLKKFSVLHGLPQRTVPAELQQLLQQHDWPGNIRQLENCIFRYVILGSDESLFNELAARRLHPVSGVSTPPDGSIPLKRIAKMAARQIERSVILKALQANHWNRRKTAKALEIGYRSLLSKIQEAGLPRKRARRNTSPEPAAPVADPAQAANPEGS